MFQQKRWASVSVVVALAILTVLSACSSMSSRVGGVLNLDTDVEVDFRVAADINPDEAERPSPLYVRLYQLKSATMFDKSSFLDLYEQDQEKLGADFISKTELKPIKPGENRSESLVLDKETQYVALFAEFYQYKDAQYKLIMPVTKNNIVRNQRVVRIQGNQLQLIEK